MPTKTFSPAQIVKKLGQVERLITGGKPASVACKRAGITENTYRRWRKDFGALAERLDKFERALEFSDVRLNESLEQQTATGEILRVIARSPADTQPVFDLLAQRAGRLCNAEVAVVSRFGGNRIELAAVHGVVPEAVKIVRGLYPMPLGAKTVTARTIRAARVVHIPDVLADRSYGIKDFARAAKYRAGLGVPIVRGSQVLGAIFVGRSTAGLFSGSQVQLMKTFADQAAIAIENVRLFKELDARNRELTESLNQQTATAEVLKVISSSPTDVQPVFDTIVESVVRLCNGLFSAMFTFDGELIHQVAQHNFTAEALAEVDRLYPARPGRSHGSARAILERAVVHIPDVELDPDYSHRDLTRAVGLRSGLFVPMLRDGHPLGVVMVARAAAGRFSDSEIELLKTFADQAVIAIENVRLFNETRESLEQQTATAGILKVISSSPTNMQPVFDTIVQNAVALCDSLFANVFLFDGELLHFAASDNHTPEVLELIRNLYPSRPNISQLAGRVILAKTTVRLQDARADPDYDRRLADAWGWRRMLGVPMMRDGNPLGVIVVGWDEPGPVLKNHEVLLQTFADQAVIAIENVRLFRETKEALEQQTATSDVLKVISRSTFDLQPVLETLIQNAATLCAADCGFLYRSDGDVQRIVAAYNICPEFEEFIHNNPVVRGRGSAVGRAAIEARAVHIHDVLADPEYAYPGVRLGGYRTILGVPLLREGAPVGVFAVTRGEVLPFTEKQIELVTTFADQAGIAIENVRLFKELQTRNLEVTESLEQQTATSEILRIISSSPTNTDPVFDAIVKSGVRLFGGMEMSLRLVSGDHTELVATTETGVDGRYFSTPLNDESRPTTRAILRCEVVHIADITAEQWVHATTKERARRRGHRAVLHVPMVRDGTSIGAISVYRGTAAPFTAKEVALLQTFADQAVIAIENVRLFNEIQDKSRQLQVASQHKSEFLANMSHELRTPLNAVIGFSEVLQERMFGELTDKQAEYVNDIHSSGAHLLSLINDILDLSKVEAGRMELDVTRFSLPLAIENALTLIKERAGRHGIALECAIDDALGDIHADERKMKQIMLNLLSNAVKFTPDGGRVSVAAKSIAGGVEISVSDTGCGIAAEDCNAVFEEFRQVGPQSNTKAEGTGLGLALARKFVEMHGGKIGVTSEPGKGSTFTFSLMNCASAASAPTAR